MCAHVCLNWCLYLVRSGIYIWRNLDRRHLCGLNKLDIFASITWFQKYRVSWRILHSVKILCPARYLRLGVLYALKIIIKIVSSLLYVQRTQQPDSNMCNKKGSMYSAPKLSEQAKYLTGRTIDCRFENWEFTFRR